jgi:hypothetical protein
MSLKPAWATQRSLVKGRRDGKEGWEGGREEERKGESNEGRKEGRKEGRNFPEYGILFSAQKENLCEKLQTIQIHKKTSVNKKTPSESSNF